MNKNINNHNGKEINRDQVQKNVKKEGDTRPVDRVKNKNPDRGNELQAGESKKASVNIHKNPNNPNRNIPKGQVINMGDKDKRIHPVDSPVQKKQGQAVNPAQTPTNGKSFTRQAPGYNTTTEDNRERYKSDAMTSNESSNTGKYLYVIAAILFIAWIIGFFFYKLGANIHMLLALAIIVGVISFLQGRKK